MKLYIIVFFVLMTVFFESFCQEGKAAKINVKPDIDSTEYQLLIIDAGFDWWLQTMAKPQEFYTQSYYENWNRIYVTEWNGRFNAGKNTDIIESYVAYNSAIDYGLELNYQLYNYFQYFEASNNIVLIHRKGK